MTLAAIQSAVAMALTNGQLAPDLDAPALTLARELLVAKRRSEAGGWLPCTVAGLGQSFRERFATFAVVTQTRHDHEWNHPRADAIAFAQSVISDRTLPSTLRQIARYERAQARASRPGPFVIALHCSPSTDNPHAPHAGTHLWWRWHRGARLRYLRLPG